jgi:hypothetical protein
MFGAELDFAWRGLFSFLRESPLMHGLFEAGASIP